MAKELTVIIRGERLWDTMKTNNFSKKLFGNVACICSFFASYEMCYF